MLKILFVDEEASELQSLQELLRAFRRDWEMVFCEGAPDAISILAEQKFDVVVTELNMRGVDGAELLRYVRELYPESIRLLLCSQSEYSELFSAVGPAHQYLSKPCDPEELHDVVTRASLLKKRLSTPGLEQLVSKIDALPSLPAIYLRLIDELRQKDASVDRIGALIAKDLGMTAKVLQLVNSSFFGLPVHVKDATHAAALLGLNTLRPLVMTAGVFRQLEESKVPTDLLERVMQHSLEVGCLAKRLAEAEGMDRDSSDNAMLAGILHDIGKLVFAEHLGRDYSIVQAAANQSSLPLQLAEADQFETSHAEVGGHLAAIWGLPQDILEAVAYHHTPNDFPAQRFTAVTAVHVANVLVHEAAAIEDSRAGQPHVEQSSSKLDQDYLTRIGCSAQLPLWRELANQCRAGS